jgi:GAF domain-containing protein
VSASAFLQWVTQALYLLISLVVLTAAIRRPSRARVDIAAFFAVITAIIVEGWLIGALDITPGPLLNALVGALLMTLPYLLVRLVNDFAAVPSLVLRGAELGLALSIVALFALAGRLPAGVGLLMALYFFGFNIYAAVAFWRAGRRASGVTCRRMQAIAAGSVCLGVVILAAGLGGVEPAGARPATALIGQIASLASGVAFFLGFAPPPLLRSAWQEPELRAFLGRAASLPRLPDTAAIVRELERGAAQSLGAPAASIGLWDEAAGTLTYSGPNGPVPYPADALIGGRAFVAQRAVFSADAARDDPAHADLYRATSANAVLAAPITAGGTRLGVLSVFAPRAPIFAEEDLELLQLLADQGAVILESRALIDEAARVRAREEATRLKDDFLSAAAHDLKTPLTALIATAQLLERRATRQPDRPADLGAIRRIVGEAIRLRTIVVELLDAARGTGRPTSARAASSSSTTIVRRRMASPTIRRIAPSRVGSSGGANRPIWRNWRGRSANGTTRITTRS